MTILSIVSFIYEKLKIIIQKGYYWIFIVVLAVIFFYNYINLRHANENLKKVNESLVITNKSIIEEAKKTREMYQKEVGDMKKIMDNYINRLNENEKEYMKKMEDLYKLKEKLIIKYDDPDQLIKDIDKFVGLK